MFSGKVELLTPTRFEGPTDDRRHDEPAHARGEDPLALIFARYDELCGWRWWTAPQAVCGRKGWRR